MSDWKCNFNIFVFSYPFLIPSVERADAISLYIYIYIGSSNSLWILIFLLSINFVDDKAFLLAGNESIELSLRASYPRKAGQVLSRSGQGLSRSGH